MGLSPDKQVTHFDADAEREARHSGLFRTVPDDRYCRHGEKINEPCARCIQGEKHQRAALKALLEACDAWFVKNWGEPMNSVEDANLLRAIDAYRAAKGGE